MAGKRGRKPFQKTEEQSKEVCVLGACGISDDAIARILGISEATLQRHFKAELTGGREKALATVGKTAFQMAVSGQHPAMTMFYLKCRGRWRETDRPEDADDTMPAPTKVEIVVKDARRITE